MICERALSLSTSVAVMLSVARVTYIPLRVLAVNVIAIYSRSRRNRRKPDSTTTVEPVVGGLYSPDELLELRRNGEDARDTLVLEGGHQQIGAFCHAAEIPLAPDSAFSARCGSLQFGRMK